MLACLSYFFVYRLGSSVSLARRSLCRKFSKRYCDDDVGFGYLHMPRLYGSQAAYITINRSSVIVGAICVPVQAVGSSLQLQIGVISIYSCA
jgi:hypothetical protein